MIHVYPSSTVHPSHPPHPPHPYAGTTTLLRAAYLRAAGEEEEDAPASMEGMPAPSLADQLADDMLENAINVVDKGYVGGGWGVGGGGGGGWWVVGMVVVEGWTIATRGVHCNL